MNWQTIIKKNRKSLESTLLLASYGYHAGNNYGFVISSDKFKAETATELMNKVLEISARRLYPYKSNKQYSKVTVKLSLSGTGIYIEYTENK